MAENWKVEYLRNFEEKWHTYGIPTYDEVPLLKSIAWMVEGRKRNAMLKLQWRVRNVDTNEIIPGEAIE